MQHILAAEEAVILPELWTLAQWLLETFGRTDVTTAVVNILAALLCVILPYLLGSLQPAIIFSRLIWHGDICKVGNGKPDTVNMMDAYGWRGALLTVLGNAFKTVVALAVGLALWGFNGRAFAAFFVLFGHLFPVFSRFRGGRGVTCLLLSSFLLFDPYAAVNGLIVGAILAVIFLVGTLGTRMVSFGTLLAAVMFPVILNALYTHPDLSVAMAVLMTVFVAVAHWESIKRIPVGEEEKIELSSYFGKGRTKK